jgi:hypothetical protein
VITAVKRMGDSALDIGKGVVEHRYALDPRVKSYVGKFVFSRVGETL